MENVPTGLRAGRAEADVAAGFAGAEASPSGRLVKGPGVCAGRTGRDRFPLAGLEKGRVGRCCFLGGFMAGLAMGGQAQKWNGSDSLQTLESEFQDRESSGRRLRPHRVCPACGRPRERIFCKWNTAPLGHPDRDRGTPGAAGACRSDSSCRHPVHRCELVTIAAGQLAEPWLEVPKNDYSARRYFFRTRVAGAVATDPSSERGPAARSPEP